MFHAKNPLPAQGIQQTVMRRNIDSQSGAIDLKVDYHSLTPFVE
jgi:hypothetical protein